MATDLQLIQIILGTFIAIILIFSIVIIILKKRLKNKINNLNQIEKEEEQNSFTEIAEETVKRELERDTKEETNKYRLNVGSVDDLKRIKSFISED